jgi:hypothetical protein
MPVVALISWLGLAATQSVIPWTDWVCELLACALEMTPLTDAAGPEGLGKPTDPVLTGSNLDVAGGNKADALIFIWRDKSGDRHGD